jgi:hypothetical protein
MRAHQYNLYIDAIDANETAVRACKDLEERCQLADATLPNERLTSSFAR